MDIDQPTDKQCDALEVVFQNEHKIGYAIWYPQRGGYAGKAVAIVDKAWREHPNGTREGGCIDVLVWHDGEFPFGDGNPQEIHHCDPYQFIEFGHSLVYLNEGHRSI